MKALLWQVCSSVGVVLLVQSVLEWKDAWKAGSTGLWMRVQQTLGLFLASHGLSLYQGWLIGNNSSNYRAFVLKRSVCKNQGRKEECQCLHAQ